MKSLSLHHIDKMKPYQAGEQPRSKAVVKLNTNENSYPPPKIIKTMLETISLTDLKNYPPIDKGDLVALLAKKNVLREQEVCCGNGLDEMISAIFRAFIGDQKKATTHRVHLQCLL